MFIVLHLFLLLLLFIYPLSADSFSPDTSDYNAYGLKIAANDLMIVEAQNDYTQFLVQFSPYTDNVTETIENSCWIEYDDPSQYIYTVVLGKNQSTYNIFFVGEMIDMDEDTPLENRTFVGILSYNYTGSPTTIDCNYGFSFTIKFVPNAFPHQERLVMTTDPLGSVAYGFSDLFTFSYTAATNILIVHVNNSFSSSTSFLPSAVDYDGHHGIISGFISNGQNSRIKYSATVFLFSINASTAIATPISSWTYPMNATTWQASLSNPNADTYAAKYDMSVSINPTATLVLIGIQSMNTVFLFSYTTTTLTLITSKDNGQGIGFGKGVVWLNDTLDSAAILANVYSTSYVWISSKIYLYDSPLTSISVPVSIFPNIQQSLYSYMSSVFLNIISTPSNLVLLDNQGDLFVILSAPNGYYPSTVGPTEEISPAFSSELPCIPGTYKNVTGIRWCEPCPTGTKKDGTNVSQITCVDCANNAFCPLGSTSDSISDDLLSNIIQVFAHPKSPDITGIDDIVFLTLFSIGSTGRCVALSPIFWTLIAALIVVIIGSVMVVMKYYFKGPKAESHYKMLEKLFRQIDVIREGELWIGGLATVCVFVLVLSCYIFSAKYYNSYPIETAGPSTYTCDTTLANAQFTSSLQSLSIPVATEIQDMFDLLNDQPLNLNVAFLNTVYNCTSDEITLTYLLGTTSFSIPSTLYCNSSNYILSYSALLPFRSITLQFNLPNIYTIGGLRVGLSASGQVKSSTQTLQDLNFSQIFSQSGRMLGQNVNINLQLTKVINDTSPLVGGGDEIISGIWSGSLTTNYYESFFAASDYLNATTQTSTNVTIVIGETSYYILNQQDPIARLPEIIFHNFLITIVTLELFGLLFLIVKLVIKPLTNFLVRKCKPDFGRNNRGNRSSRSRSSVNNDDLEISTSKSNTEEDRDQAHNNNIGNDVIPSQRQISHLNEDPERNGNGSQCSLRPVFTTVREGSHKPVSIVRVESNDNKKSQGHKNNGKN